MAILPAKDDFLRGIEKGVIAPVYLKKKARGFEPAVAFGAFRDSSHPFLLESAKPNPVTGRYSFMGGDPYMTFKTKGRSVEISRAGRRVALARAALEKLRELMGN